MLECCLQWLARQPTGAAGARLRRLRVERSEDHLRYRLFSEADGHFLMFAQASGSARIDFFLYDPKTQPALFDSKRPAFTLTCNAARKEWRLLQERCDNCRCSPCHMAQGRGCCGQSELFFAQHFSQAVGEGVNHCMDVVIPTVERSAEDTPDESELRLITRLPVWSDKVDSLVLDFKGRRVQPSAKNFQLMPEDRPKTTMLQYGKIGQNTFGLDFRHPLTVAQAFGLSLTTLLWA